MPDETTITFDPDAARDHADELGAMARQIEGWLPGASGRVERRLRDVVNWLGDAEAWLEWCADEHEAAARERDAGATA